MKRVAGFAVVSRLVILLLATITNHTLRKYDTSNEVSNHFLTSFTNWDGVHFLDVSTNGEYRYEKLHAFFPFLPWTVRIIANFLIQPIFQCSSESSIIVSAYVVSNVSFVIAACLLDRLGRDVLRDPRRRREARLAVLLFCLNPASIFMSAFYTESLFSMLSFGGMLLAYHNHKYAASLIFCLTAATRSNGVLLSVLFIGLPSIWMVYSRSTNLTSFTHNIWTYFIPSILPTIIPFLPFVLFQAYASRLYCDLRPWCDVTNYAFPLRLVSNVLFGIPIGMYSWIQNEYWGNGLFSYWTLKQIPNFLLASPMIFISCKTIMTTCFIHNEKRTTSFFHSCFRIHWILLFIIAFFTMNIQVTTRFLSACPSLYWYLARTFLSTHKSRYWIVAYSTSYMFLGAVMFTSFYPWT